MDVTMTIGAVIATSTSPTTCFALLRPITSTIPISGSITRHTYFPVRVYSSFGTSNSNESFANMSPNNLEPIIPWCDTSTKRVLLLRHGQAVHNPRAEAARENGCPFDEFLSLMREDDAFDSPLTELGEHQAIQVGRQLQQALHNIDMIVSSPLSRALRTADLVLPPSGLPASSNAPRRVCVEELREINGSFLNAKRRPRSELEHRFPHWNFGHIPDIDGSWTDELESQAECSERGYSGLIWMMQQREQNILAVCHGGLLNYTMNNHSKILLSDKRKFHNSEEERRCITKRFGNCEMREFRMAVLHDSNDARPTEEKDLSCTQPNGEKSRPLIIMEEVTMEMNDLYALTDDENINVI